MADRSARARRARLFNKAAEHLAYDVWHYEKPNEGAVAHAGDHLRRAIGSLEAVGFTVAQFDLVHDNDVLRDFVNNGTDLYVRRA